ncbi:MAG: hypothetical protein JNK90_14895 [Planctomycetaceae bacterium]|nr:hypothetical protein [Planctomycetaceae bacterium]
MLYANLKKPAGRYLRNCVIRVTTIGLLWAICFFSSNPCLAQQPPESDSDILSEELLKDIVPKDLGESADNADANKANSSGAGRSFGAGENPFEVISLGMLTASKYLREGQTGSTTQDVQNNVLLRLDELIEQSEKQSKKPRSSQSSSASQRTAKRQTQPQQSKETSKQRANQRTSADGGQESEDQGEQQRQSQDPQDGNPESDMPNGNGKQAPDGSRSSKADLGDAKALQQGVWGHLPERIRQQMMSRMVERFLPEYEASIEEYFRKLSDSEEESQKP